jgi:hypothetical protein
LSSAGRGAVLHHPRPPPRWRAHRARAVAPGRRREREGRRGRVAGAAHVHRLRARGWDASAGAPRAKSHAAVPERHEELLALEPLEHVLGRARERRPAGELLRRAARGERELPEVGRDRAQAVEGLELAARVEHDGRARGLQRARGLGHLSGEEPVAVVREQHRVDVVLELLEARREARAHVRGRRDLGLAVDAQDAGACGPARPRGCASSSA